jgi:hypothetical protein
MSRSTRWEIGLERRGRGTGQLVATEKLVTVNGHNYRIFVLCEYSGVGSSYFWSSTLQGPPRIEFAAGSARSNYTAIVQAWKAIGERELIFG